MSTIWFKHPSDSLLADARLKALVRKHGAAGYAAYYALVERLYRNGGEAVDEFTVDSIAHDLKLSPRRMGEILNYAASAECDGLIQKSIKGFESIEVAKTVEHNRKAANKRSDNARRAVQARWRKAQERRG